MYVKSITIGKFRHLENIELGPFDAPGKLATAIALAGPNGGGKSSILELLGYALSNSWSLSWVLNRSFTDHSFEVAFALNDADISIIRRWLEDTNPEQVEEEAAEELIEAKVVYRGYNMADGVYATDATKQNRMFNITNRALKDHYQRSIGLFLRADRSYPNKKFDTRKILQWDSIKAPGYKYSLAFNSSDLQYQDMYDHLVQRRYHYFRELGEYHHKEKEHRLEPSDEKPVDPLKPYDQLLNRLFPEYRFEPGDSDIPGDLFISIDRQTTLPFRDLSSGEKEVFFILASMLRHDVKNAIVVVDEPELHLHPEFGRLLVRELLASNEGNQIWFATHNSEVIDEVGADSTLFVSRDKASRKAVITKATEVPHAAKMLRELFGFSGYIGIGRSLVFLEGTDASADRKIMSRLLPEGGGSVKLVPAGGVTNLTRINAAVLKILEDGLGQMQFYLIRDRDYLTDEQIKSYHSHASNRIRVLAKHQIENYLLVPDAISQVLTEIYNQTASNQQVLDDLEEAAKTVSGEVAAGLVRQQIEGIWVPEEMLPTGFLRSNSIIDSSVISEQNKRALLDSVTKQAGTLLTELGAALSPKEIMSIVTAALKQTSDWLEDGQWIDRYPGKQIIKAYASRLTLGDPTTFQNSVLKVIANDQENLLDSEIRSLFADVSSAEDNFSS